MRHCQGSYPSSGQIRKSDITKSEVLRQAGADVGQARIAQKQALYYNSGKQNQQQEERENGGQ
jgi:hypothetical protein